MSRYDQLLQIIDLVKPQSIVEIGTWRGRSAVKMIRQAQKYRKNIRYVGYDLFEDATDQTDSEELNLKQHFKAEDVEDHINAECPGAFVNLIKGNTRDTLKPIEADLVFIDGGHSLETIRNDYDKCKHSRVIILDDYYIADKDGNIPDLSLYGCNRLVDSLSGAIVLPLGDKVKTGGITMMALTLGVK